MIMLLDSGSEGIYMMKMNVECKCSLTWRARLRPSVRPTRVHRILHRMYLAFTMYVTYGCRRREGNRYLEKTWHGEKEGEGGTRERGAENENGLARSLGIVCCSVLSDFPFRSNNNGSSIGGG